MTRTVLRGALIDVDGVLHISDVPIPGSIEALATLRARGIPLRLLTNSTTRTRASLGAALRDMGFDVTDAEIITAPIATAAYVRRRFPGLPCYAIVTGNVLDDFDGIQLSDGTDARVVIIGGAEERFTFNTLNHAFRLLLDGAALVAMHRNPYWMTADGPTLDAGAFIRALEHASGRRAIVVGKPATPFFRSAFRSLGLPPSQIIMVGDDLRQDVLPAMRLGATGALVRTGKFRASDLDAGTPDHVLNAVADLPAVFDRSAHMRS
jgi:HAD superfamily hydrolase (TIGR01458 family)